MRTLAGWCHRHRILVVAVWLLAAAAATAAEAASGSAYSDNFKLPHTESFAAVQLLQRYAPRASGDTEQVVVAVRQGTVSAPAIRAQMDSLLAEVARRPHVAGVVSPY